ncbi:MAG: phosphatase PAP2 family protein [Kofleriaceae bacterium]
MTRFAVLLLVLGSTMAAADPAPDSHVPPATDAAGSGSGSGSGEPAALDATPAKVEHAKDVAAAAALTPINPSPKGSAKPAFQLYAEIDVPILAVGTVFALARLTKTSLAQKAFCAPLCTDANAGTLNPLDNLVKGRYSAAWSTASDFELYGLGAAATAVLFTDESVLNALNDGVVIGEATLSATAVASIMTLAAGRPRPFLYGTNAPESVRDSSDAALSFLSSHAAEAFAITTSLYVAEHRLHPNSSRPKWILAGGLALSSMIAVSRVMSGYHFITDVVGGAVVGSSLGVLIASMHGSPVQIIPVVNRDEHTNATSATLGIQGTF